jgi:uncharacterized protein
MSARPPQDPHHHTRPPSTGEERDALELTAEENADLCRGCVKCCTYITIEIDAPRAAWEYDQWIWALHHRNIQLYVERPERWFVHVETVCEQLDERGRCSIYGRHPVLCREYDPRSCERRLPLADVAAWFENGAALEQWLRARRPRHWERLMAYRSDMPEGPPVAGARADRAPSQGLVHIAGLAAPALVSRGAARGTRRRA